MIAAFSAITYMQLFNCFFAYTILYAIFQEHDWQLESIKRLQINFIHCWNVALIFGPNLSDLLFSVLSSLKKITVYLFGVWNKKK